jgi:2-polyprenyl-6-methoxyphenol hydroxylase-like FAD-dependent oxidoreductase
MPFVENALIVGGGVAGMSLAICLRRLGIAVEIAEIDPQWRVYGAGITITGPSLRAFDRLGLLDRIMQEGYCSGATRICDQHGNVLVPARVTGAPLGERIPLNGGILRPVLHRMLSEATRAAGAAVRLGVSAAAIEQTGGKATVMFTDGSRGDYDLVVGADGVHSRVRNLLFPHAPRPAFTGQGCWRAVVARPPDIDRSVLFVGGRVKPGVTPVSQAEMYLFLVQHVPGNPRMPEREWPRLLAEQLEGFGGILADIRAGLGEESRINYRPLEKLLLPPPWHLGRAILTGDAAHATTPHLASGAGLAVEDALVLSELIALDLPLDEVFRRFMTRRYERCRLVVENSARLGEMEMQRAPPQEQAALSSASVTALCAPI